MLPQRPAIVLGGLDRSKPWSGVSVSSAGEQRAALTAGIRVGRQAETLLSEAVQVTTAALAELHSMTRGTANPIVPQILARVETARRRGHDGLTPLDPALRDLDQYQSRL